MSRTLLAAALLLAACDTEVDAVDPADGAEILATVAYGDSTVRFHAGDEVAFVSETSDAEATSLLAELLPLELTPLELHGLLTTDAAPDALVRHHEVRAELLDLPVQPRTADEILDALDLVQTSSSYIEQLHTTSCTNSSDLSWFRGIWQSMGWNWGWYWRSSATGHKYTATASNRDVFMTHLCNQNRPGYVSHCALGGKNNSACQIVAIGERSVIYGLGNADYRGLQTSWLGTTGAYKLGAAAP
jgi:hypothetical protein